MAPVMATTPPSLAASFLANSALAARLSSVTASSGLASTPRVLAAAPATALTSLMLPRTTVTGSLSISSEAVEVRSSDAPAPTGSTTMG